MRKMQCGECSNQELALLSVKGKSFAYMQYTAVEIKVDVYLWTCICGNHILESGDCRRLDIVIEKSLAMGETMTPEEAAKKLIELDARRPEIKQFYEDVSECLEALEEGAHFQDEDDKTVFLVELAKGKFVTFDKFKYIRTKKAEEKRGELSVKRAKELGYDL